MSAQARGKTTPPSRAFGIPSVDMDFNESDEDTPASSSSRKGRPTLEVVDVDDDELEVVQEREKQRRRVEDPTAPTIKRIVRRAVDAAPRAGASDISTRLERIEAVQTQLTTLVPLDNASTEQLGKRIQKLEKSSGDVMKRLERVEALLEKVLERLG